MNLMGKQETIYMRENEMGLVELNLGNMSEICHYFFCYLLSQKEHFKWPRGRVNIRTSFEDTIDRSN